MEGSKYRLLGRRRQCGSLFYLEREQDDQQEDRVPKGAYGTCTTSPPPPPHTHTDTHMHHHHP